MLPSRSTRITRLSTQPDLQFVVAPGGMPVPDIRVRSPTRSASLVPTIAFAEVSPGPLPNRQRMLPGWLNASRAIVAAPRTKPIAMKSGTPNLVALQRLCLIAINRCMTFLLWLGVPVGLTLHKSNDGRRCQAGPRQRIVCETNAEPGSSMALQTPKSSVQGLLSPVRRQVVSRSTRRAVGGAIQASVDNRPQGVGCAPVG